MNGGTRILAAIMFTDIVGYTALMQDDETHAKKLRDKHRKILEDVTLEHKGSVVQYYGDGTLSIFGSAVEAVNCGIRIQQQLQSNPVVPVRIGIHLGDIVYDDEGVFGDGVNTASRIENMAIPGSLLISDRVHDELLSHPEYICKSLGIFNLKNVKRPIEVFAVQEEKLIIPTSGQVKSARISNKKSIAVLPFVNMSNDIENEYFSDGITEELLNALAKVDGLYVTSRTSSFAFKGKHIDIRNIGEQLNVSTVLEGSVRKFGNKVRVTAQLISSADGYHIWSEVYDRDLEDIFMVQDELSSKIAHTLKEKLTFDNKSETLVKAPTKNLEAYNLLLKGKFHFNKFTPEDIPIALEYYEKALEIEPNFAEAYCAIGGCYTFLGAIGWKKPAEVFPIAKENLTKALQLNEKLPHAHMGDALYKLFYEFNFEEAEKAFKRAFKLSPNSAEIKMYYGKFLIAAGRIDEAIKHLKQARLIDPLSVNICQTLAGAYMYAKRYDEALAEIDKVLEFDNTSRSVYEFKGWVYLFKGDYDQATKYFKRYKSMVNFPMRGLTGLGYAYAKTGQLEKTKEIIITLEERARNESDTILDIDLAILYEGIGNLEKTFELIEKAFSQRVGMVFISSHPGWEHVRKDPRYDELMKKYSYSI